MKKLTVMTAASEQQLASWDEKAEHGLFTHHLLDALYGKADGDKDGQVTATEAKRYLDRHMTRAARRIYGRHQKASLSGDEAVVLTAAVEGRFAARPVYKPGSVTASPAPAGAKAEPVKAAVAPAPDHAASEQALGLKREGRVLVQRGLGSMGLGVGYADGLFGEKTRGAIREWQEGKGFKVTGYLTGEQAEALREMGEEERREQADRERKQRERGERERKARAAAEAEARARAEAERERLAQEAAERERREREAEANGYGLHDMRGNVWEWVEDCWHDSYYRAPLDGSVWTAGGDCGKRVLRGGSWVNGPGFLRSAFRGWNIAGVRSGYNGFRVARTPTP